ncbi:deoxyribonuclease [Spirochaetia bacterium]|nr:deoxyribonuclease [Spirochaetia bacterium]
MKNPSLGLLAVLVMLTFASGTLRADEASRGEEYFVAAESGRIKIVSFNIQIFGTAKMARPEVAAILADIVSQADITAIQEVRSAAPDPVEAFMALLPPRYAYVLGPREGRSSSKEQYWVIYDTEKFTVLGEDTWADPDDIYERNPLAVYFQTAGQFDFILINNHIQPGNAAAEINALPLVSDYYRALWDDGDVLIMGDFNADGSYYDESLLADVFPEGEYRIIIPNTIDTTVAPSDNTYDRIIITGFALEDYADSFGVIRFDELYDFSQMGIIPAQVSDHYPVWAEFFIDRDTD